MRIAATCLPTDISLSIAASIFVAAGVIIVFIVNLVFAQRIIRAQHPNSGWHPFFRMFFNFLYALVILTIIMLITVVVQSFYTLNANTHRIDRDIQLYGVTTFAIISFLPIPIVIGGLLIPRKQHVDKFGTGRFRSKIAILLTASTLVSVGACYRAGTTWLTPVPITKPLPAYFHPACFYIFNFGVEIIVLYLYAILRIDHRFHIPDGAKGPGSYSKSTTEKRITDTPSDINEPAPAAERIGSRVYTEEETFDDSYNDDETVGKKSKDIEAGEDTFSYNSSPEASRPPTRV
jgi:hypothetical protein